jgi:Arc/MetJ-type ribon-helix-helix transcriptional regulator
MLQFDMDSPWDGRERRRGHSSEALREHLRQLREAWEAIQRDTQLKNDDEKPTLGVQGDNDEERCARVDAMLEKLRPTEKPTRKVVVRSKTLGSRRVSQKR